jgi:hypothetical protein
MVQYFPGRAALGLLLGAAAVSQTLQAQTATGRPGSFREEARVERVIVDAYVTDRYGDPIPDLGPEDFRLRVDEKPVPIFPRSRLTRLSPRRRQADRSLSRRRDG